MQAMGVKIERTPEPVVDTGITNCQHSALDSGIRAGEREAVQIAGSLKTAIEAAPEVCEHFGEDGGEKRKLKPVGFCCGIQLLFGDGVVRLDIEGIQLSVYVPDESADFVLRLVPRQCHPERPGILPSDGEGIA